MIINLKILIAAVLILTALELSSQSLLDSGIYFNPTEAKLLAKKVIKCNACFEKYPILENNFNTLSLYNDSLIENVLYLSKASKEVEDDYINFRTSQSKLNIKNAVTIQGLKAEAIRQKRKVYLFGFGGVVVGVCVTGLITLLK